MHFQRIRSRLLACLLVASLPVCFSPAVGGSDTATLTGVVFENGTRSPLSGVQVHVADQAGQRFFVSEATGDDGTFRVEGLPATDCEVGLEFDGGLYLVGNTVRLAPGRNHLVEVTLNLDDEDDDDDGATFWQNPLTAATLVTGAAILIGLLLEEAVGDDEPISPLVP